MGSARTLGALVGNGSGLGGLGIGGVSLICRGRWPRWAQVSVLRAARAAAGW